MGKVFIICLLLAASIASFTNSQCAPAYPIFPKEFLFSSNGKPPRKTGSHGVGTSYKCIQVNEPSDKTAIWENNYFCHFVGPGYRSVSMVWSYKGL